MKVIFLDIDGVLNSGDYMNATHILNHKHGVEEVVCSDEYGHTFDPRCVLYLDHILRETGAKLVISSTWRYSGLKIMQEMWAARNLPGEVIDITPLRSEVDPEIEERFYDPRAGRGYEIQDWLERNQVESYVILDDDSDMISHQPLVKCPNRFGITYEVAKETIQKLNTIKDGSNK